MYRIPLTNAPNQTFNCTIPVNGNNKEFRFDLWYNYEAEYWLLTLSDVKTEQVILSNIPLLCSNSFYYDIFYQLGYLKIGICSILPIVEDIKSMPDNTNLGTSYLMIWGDNNE